MIHGRFCGKKIPPVIRSITQTLYVLFVSEKDSQWKGFTAHYSQVPPVTETGMHDTLLSLKRYRKF